jgi:hypothetical protein
MNKLLIAVCRTVLKRLILFRLVELVQLMSPKDQSKLKKEELLGRESGSAAWRLARGEMGLGIEKFCSNVWKLTEDEKKAKVFHLEYDVAEDVYVRRSNGGERVVGWQNGLAECEDVIRKEEFDWGQIYLARRGDRQLHRLLSARVITSWFCFRGLSQGLRQVAGGLVGLVAQRQDRRAVRQQQHFPERKGRLAAVRRSRLPHSAVG